MSFLFSLALSLALAGAPPSRPQSPTVSDSAQRMDDGSAMDPDGLPVSIQRIQRALLRPAVLRVTSDKPVFRVEIFGRKPTIEDILGPDYLRGPVPYGGMTHQEFLNMVTPKDVQGYAAFSNKEGAVVALTSLAQVWALQKAIHKFQTAKEEREREAARREVQDALADLTRARKAAGLPPK